MSSSFARTTEEDMIDNASSIPNQAMTHVPIGGMAKVYKATRGGGRIRNNALVGL